MRRPPDDQFFVSRPWYAISIVAGVAKSCSLGLDLDLVEAAPLVCTSSRLKTDLPNWSSGGRETHQTSSLGMSQVIWKQLYELPSLILQ